ncbi:LacI family transcriptional regulator [Plastorhodobacter daqingensis]|uniref:LacI family transcriptional regulator n=1 Tax=Plastorhodobacter daqingensis TaxID=1387281 RepID=A0ABW2UHZ2_9RHOB
MSGPFPPAVPPLPEGDSVPLAAPARPTLKTIAALTGLAVATVSRALKDAPDIGEATKERVRAVAHQVGYRPNRAGVRLRTGKTNVVALVLSAEHDVMNHTARLIYSVAAALRETPYHMIVMPFFASEDPMLPIRYLVESGSADGIIINQIRPQDPRVRYMHDRNVPFATHGRSDMGISHAFADFDNEGYARLAVQALAARGRRRLVLISPPADQSYGAHMIRGFLDEARRCNLSAEVLPDVSSDAGGDRIEAVLRGLHSRAAPMPDGFVSGSTTGAVCAVAAAEAAGRQIGTDFDVAAKEAIPFLHRFRKDMIVVREDISHVGDFLARAVINAIEARSSDTFQWLEQPFIHPRRAGA